MFTMGNDTYRASIDIRKGTLVRIKYGVNDLIPHVEPSDEGLPILGYTADSVLENGIVSVRPLDSDGYPQIRFTYFNGVNVGDPLYVTSTGTVTDAITEGTLAGHSLVKIDNPDEEFVIFDIAGGAGFSSAAHVTVEDVADHYNFTPKNVENAMKELGVSYAISDRLHVSMLDSRSLLSHNVTRPASEIAGIAASDSPLPVVKSVDGLYTHTPIGGLVDELHAVTFKPTTDILVNSSNPIDISVMYRWAGSYDSDTMDSQDTYLGSDDYQSAHSWNDYDLRLHKTDNIIVEDFFSPVTSVKWNIPETILFQTDWFPTAAMGGSIIGYSMYTSKETPLS